jgi:hypothetical protein
MGRKFVPPVIDRRQPPTAPHGSGHSLGRDVALEAVVFVVVLLLLFSNVIIANFAIQHADIDKQVYDNSSRILRDVYRTVIADQYKP